MAGFPCVLAIVDTAPQGKLRQMQAYGARLFKIRDFGLNPELTRQVMGSLPELARAMQAEVLISAFAYSPLGMAGQPPLAFDLSHAPPGSVIYDIVTHPLDTPLLQAARAAGLPTVDGLSMLIGQAAVAFEKFFARPAPRANDADLRALLTS